MPCVVDPALQIAGNFVALGVGHGRADRRQLCTGGPAAALAVVACVWLSGRILPFIAGVYYGYRAIEPTLASSPTRPGHHLLDGESATAWCMHKEASD
jgi:hypothetical protein